MVATVSMLRPAVINPATRPEITPTLEAALSVRIAAALDALRAAKAEFPSVAFANSFGAEDMVLTDLILTHGLGIDMFSLDTGRLPPETYTLMADVEARYSTRLKVFFPETTAVEDYVREHGINAFYGSVERRKACCRIRKVEPLKRALTGREAWITGLRAAQSATRTELALREHDASFGIAKFNPLAAWSEPEVWAYIRIHNVPYNALHDQFYPSIGCAPCTRAIAVGEDIRAGRWWWEDASLKECGLHVKTS
ncbi:MAG: phosphoadenylyl-sulfate reductase [Rhodocyclaceae bacterium]|nr:phosphoadenylyl-sulfate reductase [Rhodocyclaceae bacterium]